MATWQDKAPPALMRPQLLLISLCLLTLTLAVFWPVTGNEFVAYDDQLYITANAQVLNGLSWDGLGWAFTTFEVANWHPVTWLSHQLDVTLFGLDAGAHHRTSLFLHSGNVLLLLGLLVRLTGAIWRSALVTAIFALHPLRVESVAWAAERKDLLCALFFLLALHAYLNYAARPLWRNMLLVSLWFALSLMSKPMTVTLPFVLLLLDWWPLQRLQAGTPTLRTLLLEKLPLFILSALSCVVTIVAQRGGGAVIAVEKLSVLERAANAFASYLLYLWQTIWPSELVVLYPLAITPPMGVGIAAAVALAFLTIAIFRQRQSRPYLLMGWLWYLGMLVPVIGLMQVGLQAHADRYTYLPMIGCCIASVWYFEELVTNVPMLRSALILVSGAAIFALGIRTRAQVHLWHDSETLFRHALSITRDNYVMHTNLGIALWDADRPDEAISELRKAVAICPTYADQRFILGNALLVRGDLEGAAAEYRTVLKLVPDYAHADTNLGMALQRAGKQEEAVAAYRQALRRDPQDYKASRNLQDLLGERGR